MNRHIIERWTRFLAGAPGPSDRIDDAEPDLAPEVREALRGDWRVDALLRAHGRKLGGEEADGFVAAVQRKLQPGQSPAEFTQGVLRQLRRRRRLRRLGAVGACVALAAAAAWFVGRKPSVPGRTRHEQTESIAQDAQSDLGRGSTEKRNDSSTTPLQRREVTTSPSRALLFVVGFSPLKPNDATVLERFIRLGFAPKVALQSQLVARDTDGMSLLAISSSVESKDFPAETLRHLTKVPVPLVVWEPWLWDDLELANCHRNSGCGWMIVSGELRLPRRGHPLVAWPDHRAATTHLFATFSYGIPFPAATVVATADADETRNVLFVYERGARLRDDVAPARRVALFLSDDTALTLTDDGWALFDGAMTWAAAGSPDGTR